MVRHTNRAQPPERLHLSAVWLTWHPKLIVCLSSFGKSNLIGCALQIHVCGGGLSLKGTCTYPTQVACGWSTERCRQHVSPYRTQMEPNDQPFKASQISSRPWQIGV